MASVQRTWRRDWCCVKPSWQSMARVNLMKGRNTTRGKVKYNFIDRRKRLTKTNCGKCSSPAIT